MDLVVGMDVHEDTVAVSIIDRAGREREATAVENTVAGHERLTKWLLQHAPGDVRDGSVWRDRSWASRRVQRRGTSCRGGCPSAFLPRGSSDAVARQSRSDRCARRRAGDASRAGSAGGADR